MKENMNEFRKMPQCKKERGRVGGQEEVHNVDHNVFEVVCLCIRAWWFEVDEVMIGLGVPPIGFTCFLF